MKRLRKIIKNKISYILNHKKRAEFFRYIDCEYNFSIQETKHTYELIFEDKTKTILPKTLFSFIKRLDKDDKISLKIGKNTYLQNLKLDISLNQQVRIGSYCSFGPNVTIKPDGVRGKAQFTTYPLDFIDYNSKVFNEVLNEVKNNFVKIGNDCFIGEDVKIMANVTISDGVIIGERSLVTNGKTLEPYGIYAGIPAKLIGFRYSEDMINEFMRIKWWEWSKEKIQQSGLANINHLTEYNIALSKLKEM